MHCFFAWNRVSNMIEADNLSKRAAMTETQYIIDSEFKRLLPELSSWELSQLETNILNEGCRDPIVIWDNIIVDGHHRYEICQKHKLSFQVVQKQFSCREDAMRWICLNQMGRRNLSPELFRYQVGKRYNVEKKLSAHNPHGHNQYTEVAPEVMVRPPMERRKGTAASLAKEYNVSHFAICTYKDIATAIDQIAEKDSRLVERYLSGRLRIKKDDLTTIANMSKWQVRALTNNLIRQNKTICRSHDVLEALSERDLQKDNQRKRERRMAQPMSTLPSVKDMPQYDPDGEVASLSLTIPSWSSSIGRVYNNTNMNAISDKAKTQLRSELLSLRDNIDQILKAIEEVEKNV